MGLFSAKMCELCGDKAGMLTKLKLSEGFLCGKCKKRLSQFSSGWRERTIEDVRAHLAAREENRAVFASLAPDRLVGPDGILRIDSARGAFVLAFGRDWDEGNPTVFPLKALLGARITPTFDVFEEDSDDDGVPDRFDSTPGATAPNQALGPAISQGLGLSPTGAVFDATALQGLVASSGVAASVEIGSDARDIHGYPREVIGFSLKFALDDPYAREAVWTSDSVEGSPARAIDVFTKCAEVALAVQQMRGGVAAMPGAYPQPGGYPAQPGAYPQAQPGYAPQAPQAQPGAYPQPGYPSQPGYPVQPGAYPQPGGYPVQPGAYPQQGVQPQPGGYPQQGYPQQ